MENNTTSSSSSEEIKENILQNSENDKEVQIKNENVEKAPDVNGEETAIINEISSTKNAEIEQPITIKNEELNLESSSNENSDQVLEKNEETKLIDVSLNEKENLSNKKENQSNENEYIEIVFKLESEKQALFEESKSRINQLRKELEEMHAENERLKKKNAQLEQSLVQKEANGTGSDLLKSKKEQQDVLTKAKTLLFEKTKVCKQQEQHIGMLKTQVDAIKEVLAVTKDMLNLRNTENEHLQSRLEAIELRFNTEKERQTLLEKKLDISKKMYDELRKEYDYQSNLHKEIKAAYELKSRFMENEMKKLTESAEEVQEK